MSHNALHVFVVLSDPTELWLIHYVSGIVFLEYLCVAMVMYLCLICFFYYFFGVLFFYLLDFCCCCCLVLFRFFVVILYNFIFWRSFCFLIRNNKKRYGFE